MRARLSFVAFGLALALTPACTVRSRPIALDDTGPATDDTGSGLDAGMMGFPDLGPLPDTGGELARVRIFAHSNDTLYSFSPYTNTVQTIGVFHQTGGGTLPNMLDLAVDSMGNIFTSSNASLWSVDPMTAQVTEVAAFDVTGEAFNALTFLARGELHADREALVGATNAGNYYEIDPTTAHASFLGQYPNGWLSSGDIVSVEGLGTYATVKQSGDTHDTLVQITFSASGSSSMRVIGPIVEGGTEYRQIFGLGYWGLNVYGFSNAGQLIEINRDTGAGHLATTMTGASSFWGAGVTTVVPHVI